MALVRFCQRDRLQGTERSGGAIRTWGLGGSNLNTSKPPAGCGWERRGWHSPTSPCEGGSPQAVCVRGLGGGADRWQRRQAGSGPHPAARPVCIVLPSMEPSHASVQWNSTIIRRPLNTRQADGRGGPGQSQPNGTQSDLGLQDSEFGSSQGLEPRCPLEWADGKGGPLQEGCGHALAGEALGLLLGDMRLPLFTMILGIGPDLWSSGLLR